MTTVVPSYRALLSTRGTLGFFIPGLLGRMPVAMRALGVILFIQALQGSYGVAGLIGAVQTIVAALAGPRLGQLVDQYGERPVLLATSVVHTIGIVGLVWFAYADAHLVVLALCAAMIGVSSMPFSSMTRTRWTARLGRGPALERAYALEGMTDEAGFVVGPALVVWLTLNVAPPLGLIVSLVFTFVAAAGLARVPVPRVPRAGSPHPDGTPAPKVPSVLSLAGMRAILVIFLAIGAIFGAVELVMVAFAEEQGQPAAASILVSFFALGSLISALVYGMVTWRNRADTRLRVAVWTLGLCMIPIFLIPNIPLMAVMTLLTGLAISPATISATTLIERLSPPSKLTESFAWLGSSLGAGAAFGAMFGGFLIDWNGYRGGHLIALGAAVIALTATMVWAHVLQPENPDAPEPHSAH